MIFSIIILLLMAPFSWAGDLTAIRIEDAQAPIRVTVEAFVLPRTVQVLEWSQDLLEWHPYGFYIMGNTIRFVEVFDAQDLGVVDRQPLFFRLVRSGLLGPVFLLVFPQAREDLLARHLPGIAGGRLGWSVGVV